MQDICVYHIEVQGRVDERALNATSPLEMAVLRADRAATLFCLRTDQSGLIGLLRHVHRLGLVLLSVRRER